MFAVGPLVLPPFLNHPAIPPQHYVPDHRGVPSRELRTAKHNVLDLEKVEDFQQVLTEVHKSVQYLRYSVDKSQLARLAKLMPTDVLVNAPPPRKSSKHPISSILRDSLLETATLHINHLAPCPIIGGDPDRDGQIFPGAWYHCPPLDDKDHYAERGMAHMNSCRHWPGCGHYPLANQCLLIHTIYFFTPDQLLDLTARLTNVYSIHSEMPDAYGVLEGEVEYISVDPATTKVRFLGSEPHLVHSTHWLRSGYFTDGINAMCWTSRHRLGSMVLVHFTTCPLRVARRVTDFDFTAAIESDSYYGAINSAGALSAPSALGDRMEPMPDIPLFSLGSFIRVGGDSPLYVPKQLITGLIEPYLYALTGPQRFRAMAAAAPELARRLGVPPTCRPRACTYAVAMAAVMNLADETRCLIGTQTHMGFPKFQIYLHDMVMRHQWLDFAKAMRIVFKVGGWVLVLIVTRRLYVGGASLAEIAPPPTERDRRLSSQRASSASALGRMLGGSLVFAANAVARVARGTVRAGADVAEGVFEPVAAAVGPIEVPRAVRRYASDARSALARPSLRRSRLSRYFARLATRFKDASSASYRFTADRLLSFGAALNLWLPEDPSSVLPELKTSFGWNLNTSTGERGNWNVGRIDSDLNFGVRVGPFSRSERVTTETELPFWHRWLRRRPPMSAGGEDMDSVGGLVGDVSLQHYVAAGAVVAVLVAMWWAFMSPPGDPAAPEPLMDYTHSRPPLEPIAYYEKVDLSSAMHPTYKARKMDFSARLEKAPLPTTEVKEGALSLYGIGVNGAVPEVPANNSVVEEKAMIGRALVQTNPGTPAMWAEFKAWTDKNFDILFPNWVSNCGVWDYANIYEVWNARFPGAEQNTHDQARRLLSMFPASPRMFAHQAFPKTEMLTNFIGPMYAGEIYTFVGKDARIIQACKPAWNVVAGPFFYWVTAGLKKSWHLKHFMVYAAGYHGDELGREMYYAEQVMARRDVKVLEADGARWDAHMKMPARKFMHWLYQRAGLSSVRVPTGAGLVQMREMLKKTETVAGKTFHGARYRIDGTQASGEADTSTSNTILNALTQVFAYCRTSKIDVATLVAPTATGTGLPPTMLGAKPEYVVNKAQVAFANDDLDEPLDDVIPIPPRGKKQYSDVLIDKKTKPLKPKAERKRSAMKMDLEPAIHQYLPILTRNDRLFDKSGVSAWSDKCLHEWKDADLNPFYMVAMGDDSFGICPRATFHNEEEGGYDAILADLGIEMERVHPDRVDAGTFISARWWHCDREGEHIYCLGPKLGRILPKMGYTINTATSPIGNNAARAKAMGMVSDFHHVPVFNDYVETVLRVSAPDVKTEGKDVQPMKHNYLRPSRVCQENVHTREQLNRIYGIDETARSYIRSSLARIERLPVMWTDASLDRALRLDGSAMPFSVIYSRYLAGYVEETLRRLHPWFTDAIVYFEFTQWYLTNILLYRHVPTDAEICFRFVSVYILHHWLASLPYVDAIVAHTVFNNSPMWFRTIWVLHLVRMRTAHAGDARVTGRHFPYGFAWLQHPPATNVWTTRTVGQRMRVLSGKLLDAAKYCTAAFSNVPFPMSPPIDRTWWERHYPAGTDLFNPADIPFDWPNPPRNSFFASCPFLSFLVLGQHMELGQLRDDRGKLKSRRKLVKRKGGSHLIVQGRGKKHVYYGPDNGVAAHTARHWYRKRHGLSHDQMKYWRNLDIARGRRQWHGLTRDQVWSALRSEWVAGVHYTPFSPEPMCTDATKMGRDAPTANGWLLPNSTFLAQENFAHYYGYSTPSRYAQMNRIVDGEDYGDDMTFYRAGSDADTPSLPPTPPDADLGAAVPARFEGRVFYNNWNGVEYDNDAARERMGLPAREDRKLFFNPIAFEGGNDVAINTFYVIDDDVKAGPTAIEIKHEMASPRDNAHRGSGRPITEYERKHGNGPDGSNAEAALVTNSGVSAPGEQLSVSGRTGISPANSHLGVATNNGEKKHPEHGNRLPLPAPSTLLECAGGLQLTSSPPACENTPPPPMSKQKTQVEVKVASDKPKRSSSKRRSKSKSSRSRSRSRSKSRAKTPKKRTTNRKESKSSKTMHKRAGRIKKMMKSGGYGDSHTEVFHLRLTTLDTTGLAPGDQIFSLPLSPMTFDNFRLTTLGTMYLCNDLESLSLEIKSKMPGNMYGRMLVTTVADIVTGDSLPVTGGGQELLNSLSDTYKAREIAYSTSCSIPIKLTKAQSVIYNDIDSATSRESFYGLVSINLVDAPTTTLDSVAVNDPGELWLHGRVRFYRRYDVDVVEGKSSEIDMQTSVNVNTLTTVAARGDNLDPLTTFHYTLNPKWSAVLDIASNLVTEVVPGGNLITVARAFYNMWISWQYVTNDPVMTTDGSATWNLSDGEERYVANNTILTSSTIATAVETVCGVVASMYYDADDSEPYQTQSCSVAPHSHVACTNDGAVSFSTTATASAASVTACGPEDVMAVAMAKFQRYQVWQRSQVVLEVLPEDWKTMPRVKPPPKALRTPFQRAKYKDYVVTAVLKPHLEKRGRKVAIGSSHFAQRAYHRGGRGTTAIGRMSATYDVLADESDDYDDVSTNTASASSRVYERKEKPPDNGEQMEQDRRRRRRGTDDEEALVVVSPQASKIVIEQKEPPARPNPVVPKPIKPR